MQSSTAYKLLSCPSSSFKSENTYIGDQRMELSWQIFIFVIFSEQTYPSMVGYIPVPLIHMALLSLLVIYTSGVSFSFMVHFYLDLLVCEVHVLWMYL